MYIYRPSLYIYLSCSLNVYLNYTPFLLIWLFPWAGVKNLFEVLPELTIPLLFRV